MRNSEEENSIILIDIENKQKNKVNHFNIQGGVMKSGFNIIIIALFSFATIIAGTNGGTIEEKLALEAQRVEAAKEPAKSPIVEQKNLIKVLQQERQGKKEIPVPEYDYNEGIDKESLIKVLKQERQLKKEIPVPEYDYNEGVDI